MSFSSDVKNELCGCLANSSGEQSCMYGMIFFSRVTRKGFYMRTENKEAALFFEGACKKFLHCDTDLTESAGKNGTVYTVNIMIEQGLSERLSDELSAFENGSMTIDGHPIEAGAFLGGAFITAGSMTDPEKDYHLEFSVKNPHTAEMLQRLFDDNSVSCNLIQRPSKTVIYMKGSEAIEDTLTLMGAVHSSIALMNVKILKDVRNKANRIANCDNANIERTLKASENQIRDIQYILDTVGPDDLSPELYDMAMVRLENPDVSLSELGSMLEKPIGRSGVNHRLRRLSEIADEIRSERNEKQD